MDLRIQKTKASIRKAFLELRRKKPLEKITVTELSQLAKINKATFYLHYSDIYALSSDIEDELIDEVLREVSVLNRVMDAPQKYTEEIFRAFMLHREQLHSLFSGSRTSLFSVKVEQRVKAHFYCAYPEYNTPENDILLTFIIQGGFHTSISLMSEDISRSSEMISNIAALIIDKMKPNAEK